MPELETAAAPTAAPPTTHTETKQFVGESAEPEPVRSQESPEKSAERFSKGRQKFINGLHERESKKREYLGHRDLDGGGKPEKESDVSIQDYLPKSEQAQGEGAESEQTGDSPEQDTLEAIRAHYGDEVQESARKLLDAHERRPAQRSFIAKTLESIGKDQDLPLLLEKMSSPFYRDANTPVGQQRTAELGQDLANVSNAPDVYVHLLRNPALHAGMHQMSREQRMQAVVDVSVGLKMDAARSHCTNFDQVVQPLRQQLMEAVATKQLHPAVGEALARSKHAGEIMYVMATDPAEAQGFFALNPIEAIRKLGVYDHLIAEELGKSGAVRSVKRASTNVPMSAPLTRPPKLISSVPPPLEDIGGKVQKAPDVLEQALRAGDVQAYRRELNRQERARRAGR